MSSDNLLANLSGSVYLWYSTTVMTKILYYHILIVTIEAIDIGTGQPLLFVVLENDHV